MEVAPQLDVSDVLSVLRRLLANVLEDAELLRDLEQVGGVGQDAGSANTFDEVVLSSVANGSPVMMKMAIVIVNDLLSQDIL